VIERMTEFVEQCMGEYDKRGWATPSFCESTPLGVPSAPAGAQKAQVATDRLAPFVNVGPFFFICCRPHVRSIDI
jgi:hypothetical protein